MKIPFKKATGALSALVALPVFIFLITVTVSEGADPAPGASTSEQSGAKGEGGEIQERAIGGGQLNYTCTDTIDGGRKCSCSGFVDCTRMKNSGVCCVPQPRGGCISLLECDAGGNNCTCDWAKAKTAPRVTIPRAPIGGVMPRGVEGEQTEQAPETPAPSTPSGGTK